jgi:monoamine oxidase
VLRASNIRINGPISAAMRSLFRDLDYTQAAFLYLSARTPFWRSDGGPETLWSDNPRIGRVFVLGDDPPLLKVWLSGLAAGQSDLLGDDSLAARTIAAIEAARPAARGQLTALRRFSWQKQVSARGIYHHIPPGLGPAMASAVRDPQPGRIQFAGEHLALAASGMEGALESGERAAAVLLERG